MLFLLPPGGDKDQSHGVHFDVAVTTKSFDEGSGGLKMRLAVVDADLGGKLTSAKEAVSRVQFSININQWRG